MSTNKLKMNNEKTEILLIGANVRLKSIRHNSLTIGDSIIDFFSKVKKKLGIFLENNLSMDNAVSHLRKSCYIELRKIANIRLY